MLIKVFGYSDVGGRDIKFEHEITFREHIVGHRYYKRNSLSRTFGKTKANISKMLDSPSGLEAVIKWNFLGRAGSSGGWETTIVQRYVSNTKFKSYSVNRSSCKILKLRLSARFRSIRWGYGYLLATRINCLCNLAIHIDNTEWRSLYEERKKNRLVEKREETIGTLNWKVHFTERSSRCWSLFKSRFHAFPQRSIYNRRRQIRRFSCPPLLSKFTFEAEK